MWNIWSGTHSTCTTYLSCTTYITSWFNMVLLFNAGYSQLLYCHFMSCTADCRRLARLTTVHFVPCCNVSASSILQCTVIIAEFRFLNSFLLTSFWLCIWSIFRQLWGSNNATTKPWWNSTVYFSHSNKFNSFEVEKRPPLAKGFVKIWSKLGTHCLRKTLNTQIWQPSHKGLY